jgi:hypothetical protein
LALLSLTSSLSRVSHIVDFEEEEDFVSSSFFVVIFECVSKAAALKSTFYFPTKPVALFHFLPVSPRFLSVIKRLIDIP